ncbi:TOMM precursor leader peptide-binding protein [Streptacidiphilus sp. PB12-B1b]|uniref:TOMM precursor leader peptide-binding protein n=1 Tax=Streptacidiphilus sp. PB12-B1b TaxID=2705012 RepID=UPI0015FC49A1|nr:TOMM precursor leader peptide-binding protein [Streptacidiphilus sp. PB12-B1b]QMU75235.1 TOMM precursor leader peptide-binding protein [Streptacidiphilus sp. PB12-B1b]
MRPCLKPALRRAWRDRTTLQFGVGPAHRAVLESATPADAAFLDLLDGTRELPALTAAAAGLGVGAERVRELLDELRASEVLDDTEAQRALLDLPPPERARLGPDLAALSLAHPRPGAAPALMLARQRARVEVRGAGRVGAALARVLAASGVGRVQVVDGGRVVEQDCSPCGLPPESVGRPRAAAARAAVRGGAAARPDERAAAVRPPDLVVVAPRGDAAGLLPDPGLSRSLIRSGTPHLYAGVLETLGSVGPFVVPGVSPCSHCLALRRADEDPAWPVLLAQHCSGRATAVAACDTSLATALAGLAALHCLIYLDGGSPPSLGAVVDVSMVDGSMRRRRLDPHPDCGCCWSTGVGGSWGDNDGSA